MDDRPTVVVSLPAIALATEELIRLGQLAQQARLDLDLLRLEIATSRGAPGDGTLREANEQLVLALLKAQAEVGKSAAAQAQRPFAPHDAPPRDASMARQQLRQAHLQEANEHLLLAALGAQELQNAAERAQGDQSAFLAVVAHELRNPLMPIRSAAQLICQVGPAELPRLQAVIERQVEHVARLVGDLLDLSRFHAGKLRLQRGLVDLCELVPQALDTCRPAMDARRQSLRVSACPDGLVVDGDPVRLVQVLCNLLDNASKYTPEEGAIELTLERSGAEVVVVVADNGIGIRAAVLPEVFNPFVQDSHATDFHGAGLGIGLAVVRELIEAHGGTVAVTSDGVGLGSRFVVTLPLAVAPGASGDAAGA